MPGIIAGCLLVMLPAMGLFFCGGLNGGAKNLLIGNVIKSQFLKYSRLAIWGSYQYLFNTGDGVNAICVLPSRKTTA